MTWIHKLYCNINREQQRETQRKNEKRRWQKKIKKQKKYKESRCTWFALWPGSGHRVEEAPFSFSCCIMILSCHGSLSMPDTYQEQNDLNKIRSHYRWIDDHITSSRNVLIKIFPLQVGSNISSIYVPHLGSKMFEQLHARRRPAVRTPQWRVEPTAHTKRENACAAVNSRLRCARSVTSIAIGAWAADDFKLVTILAVLR